MSDLQDEISERRADPEFVARLAQRMVEDKPILDRLAEKVPFLVQSGWTDAEYVAHTNGPSYRVLFYADGTARFEHRCDRGERGVIICAPLLCLDAGHVIVSRSPLTITPSILCSDCGTHGFITKGRWVAA